VAKSPQSQRRPAAFGKPERLLLVWLNDLRKRLEVDLSWAEHRRRQQWREEDPAEDRDGLIRYLNP
jgi:hypothetical protein